MTATTPTVKDWISAFRLRTLPLSMASIAMGSFLAGSQGDFRWSIFLLAAITTLFLQILSNLANDYGDTQHGADSADRIGPARAVQSGVISPAAMKRAIIIFTGLSLVFGIVLIYRSLYEVSINQSFLFLLLGIGAIGAAIKYTAGENPYGYKGLGDVFVFLFFGLVGVAGTYFLHTHSFHPLILLPAISLGLLSAGVLNMNNMRDFVSDQKAGKITMVVRMGYMNARIYHLALISIAWLAAVVYTLLVFTSWFQFLFLLTLPFFTIHLKTVITHQEPAVLDKQLKILAFSTLLFCLTFGIGLLL